MRHFCLYVFLAFAVIFTSNPPNFAFAESWEKPLMIIRFADNSVDYEQSLDKAVKMALKKKPTVLFDLVAVAPETMDKNINKQNEKDAKFLAEKIADQIKQSGVPPEMIRTDFKASRLTKVNEIQIFVQ